HTQVSQRPDGGDLVLEFLPDRGGLRRLAVDEGAGRRSVVGRPAPLAPVIDSYHAIEGPVGVGQVHSGAEDGELGVRRFGHEIARGQGGYVLRLAHISSVLLIAGRKALLIAAVDAILDRLATRGIWLPPETRLAFGLPGEFQGHLHRLGRSARSEAPRL